MKAEIRTLTSSTRGSRRFATGGVQLLAGEPRSFLVAERPLG
jgi:hypothetical protein